jgi:hypothetical protein
MHGAGDAAVDESPADEGIGHEERSTREPSRFAFGHALGRAELE